MKYTNIHGLPATIYDAICKDTYDLDKTDLKLISVTSLIQPPKIRVLKLRHWNEIEEDISDNVWRVIGSAVHSILENVSDKDRLIEERLEEKIGDYIISGKVDIYETGHIVQDYKITSAWAITFNPSGKTEWEQQLNLYGWLYKSAGFDVKGLRVVAILRDWSKTQAAKSKDYPQLPVVVIDLPLWPIDKQELFVRDRLDLHHKALLLPDDKIPECTPEERWAKPTSWAVMKPGRKSAAFLCDSKKQAEDYLTGNKDFYIVERKGEDTRCINYCSVNKWCSYYKQQCPAECACGEKQEVANG